MEINKRYARKIQSHKQTMYIISLIIAKNFEYRVVPGAKPPNNVQNIGQRLSTIIKPGEK